MRLQIWLSKSSKVTRAYCKLFKRTIKIDSGGSSGLDSHKKGKTHEQKENQRKANVIGTFFYSSGSQDSAGTPDNLMTMMTMSWNSRQSDDDDDYEDDHNVDSATRELLLSSYVVDD